MPVRQSKETMRLEIDQLRKRQQQSERVLAALASNERAENVLEQLRSGETLENISEGLDKGKGKPSLLSGISVSEDNTNVTTYKRRGDQQTIRNALGTAQSPASPPFSTVPFSDSCGEPSQGHSIQDPIPWSEWGTGLSLSRQLSNATQSEDMMRWSPEAQPVPQPGQKYPLIGTWHEQPGGREDPDITVQWARDRGKEYLLGTESGIYEQANNYRNVNEAWTQVTSDGEFVKHLMALYFCWEYPTFASLSKEHFISDFRDGNQRYCSSLLVNAMLAVGCRFSTQGNARVDADDSNTAGDHFFAEALRLLGQETNHHKLTTIQALGLMSIREASCGRSTESAYYSGQSVRIAVEMGLHLESESGVGDHASIDYAVKSATFWGAFSLDQ